MFNQLSRRSFVAGATGLAFASVLAAAGLNVAYADQAKKAFTVGVEDTGDGKRKVTDMTGCAVEVPAEITSIATFGSVGVLNAFVECLGKGSLIVNQMPQNFTKNDKWAMQYKFAPQIADGPVVETSDGVDVEATLQLAPDLCITMMPEMAEQLNQNGLPCIVLTWNDTDDVKTAVSLMGQVLNCTEVADDYIAYFDEMVAKAADRTKDIADDDARVACIYGDVEALKNPHIISEWWIQAAGGRSVTKDVHEKNSLEYTMEQLLDWNPEVIFSSNSKVDEIYADANIADLAAVKEGKIYVVPTVAHVWGNRTVEQPLTVMWAMNKLYPELYTEEELAEDIKYFYSHFFCYDMNEDEVNGIIHYGE